MEEIKVTAGVVCLEGSIKSTDGRSTLRTLTWAPSADIELRGIVQLVHGMVEHIGRYDRFATFLAQHGFIVTGEDHIGHGKSVASEDQLGNLPYRTGADIMVQDVRSLALAIRAAYPELPYFIFGHSMGSFIVRRYCADYPEGIAGAILCGTGNPPTALSLAANALCRVLSKLHGDDYRSEKIDELGVGAYAKQVPDARTACDWICTDSAVVEDYLADPLCGAMFSVGGYGALTLLTAEVTTKDHAAQVPSTLPMLFVAGGMDPVGACGKQVLEAVELYRGAGVLDVRLVLYPGLRHEILNEPSHDKVDADILSWIEDHLPA